MPNDCTSVRRSLPCCAERRGLSLHPVLKYNQNAIFIGIIINFCLTKVKMEIHRRQTRRFQLGWLIPIVMLHVALYLTFRPATLKPDAGAQREGMLVLLHRPQAAADTALHQPMSPPLRTRPARPRYAAPRRPVPPEIAAPVTAPEAIDEPGPVGPAPVAPEAVSAAALLDRARLSVGAIDKQLRKESKNDNDRIIARDTLLATKLGAAYRDRTFSTTDMRLSNGDTISKVRTPFSTYCLRIAGHGPGAGRDPFKETGKMVFVRCPK